MEKIKGDILFRNWFLIISTEHPVEYRERISMGTSVLARVINDWKGLESLQFMQRQQEVLRKQKMKKKKKKDEKAVAYFEQDFVFHSAILYSL